MQAEKSTQWVIAALLVAVFGAVFYTETAVVQEISMFQQSVQGDLEVVRTQMKLMNAIMKEKGMTSTVAANTVAKPTAKVK